LKREIQPSEYRSPADKAPTIDRIKTWTDFLMLISSSSNAIAVPTVGPTIVLFGLGFQYMFFLEIQTEFAGPTRGKAECSDAASK
jgi:hypothetical protein